MSETEKEEKAPLRCDICNAIVPNQASLEAHQRGKRHIQNLERMQNRQLEAERSIFIAGIKDLNIPELALTDYFSQFGSVAKVTMDKNRGTFAILEFSRRESAERALDNTQHVVGGSKLIVKSRELKTSMAGSKSQMEQQHNVHNHLPPEIWNALLEAQDAESQFHILCSKLSLTGDDKHIRNLVCQLLKAALEEVFLSCEIQPFGSSINGFGIHGCDLDLNFQYRSVDYDAALEFLVQDSACKSSYLDENKNKSLDRKQTLQVIASIIKLCVPDCHQVKSILSARRPVVKFHHKASEMCCDISAGNELAVRNTEYLRDVCDNLAYFGPLVQAVRLWMKHWNLAGSTRAASPLLNNYAVTLMVLFYLHNSNEVYTLDEMRARDPDIQPCIIENWDCSFSQQCPRKSTEEKSLLQLLAGFFHFYSKCDFATKVLCLKTGKLTDVAESKTEFENESIEQSGSPKSMFRFGPLNISDPFELNHNVAGNVSRKHMASFIRCVRNAALSCDMKMYSKRPVSSAGREPWGLLNLFVDHHAKKSADQSPKNSFSEKQTASIDLKVDSSKQAIVDVVPLLITILTDVFLVRFIGNDSGGIAVEKEQNSPERKTIQLQKFSKKVGNPENLEQQVTETTRKRHLDETPTTQKKARLSLSSPEALDLKCKALLFGKRESIVLPVQFSAEVSYRVWEGRRKARRHLVQPGASDILDLERQISKLLVSESDSLIVSDPKSSTTQVSVKPDLRTFFRVDVTVSEIGRSITVGFELRPCEKRTPRNQELDFKNFCHHLEISLPNMVAKCLKVL